MKIESITFIKNTTLQNNRYQNSKSKVYNHSNNYNPIAYMDFGISFRGRTPENFYSQNFNRENMPYSMKNYLNYDYEQRKHIPPEQMMHEVFKYIEIADNFNEVKDLYPNEDLFLGLHPNTKRSISSVLYEVKTARELCDEPLFKDGSDDLGMYLLRKIYLEGKTIKEIDKDFKDKDMNPVYKGIITKPINYDTTEAYGIKYPNAPFWNSFIATREEYKKFFITLPKNTVDPNRIEAHKKKQATNKVEENDKLETKPRKYNIKQHKKNDIAREVKESKGDLKAIETKIKRRYGSDDPEASFFLKYMSPIMTLATDRIHLSEELKLFAENERSNGKSGDETYMLERFWKQNPRVLNDFAKTIPSTIEMFEEAYGIGGVIPINKNLEVVTVNTTNQYVIDKVSSEFVELLNYTQNIAPEREKRYAEHDRLQQEWEKYFVNKYGVQEEVNEIENVPTVEIQTSDAKSSDLGEKEQIMTLLQRRLRMFPNKFAQKYMNDFLNSSLYLNECESLLDSKLESSNFSKYNVNYSLSNLRESGAAAFAITDIIARNTKSTLNEHLLARIDPYISYPLLLAGSKNIIKAHSKELNELYNIYLTPLTNKEINKVPHIIMDEILAYDNSAVGKNNDVKEIILMLKESAQKSIDRRRIMREFITAAITRELHYAKSFLMQKDLSNEIKQNKMESFIEAMLNMKAFGSALINTIDGDVVKKHLDNLSPQVRQSFAAGLDNYEYRQIVKSQNKTQF